MYIQKSISRDNNRNHALYNKGIYRIFNYRVDVAQNTIFGTMRSYADIEAFNYGGSYYDDGRQIEDLNFNIDKSQLVYDPSVTDPSAQIEKAIYTWLTTNDPKYQGGQILEEPAIVPEVVEE